MDNKLTTSPIYIFFRSMVTYMTGSLLRAWSGIVTNGLGILGADKSHPHWLSWDDRIFQRYKRPPGRNLGDHRQGTALQRGGTATGWVNFFFQSLFLFPLRTRPLQLNRSPVESLPFIDNRKGLQTDIVFVFIPLTLL